MNKRLNRTQRNYIIIGLCAILLIMVVGYAAFQSQLKISGTSNIASNFLVKITNIEVSNIVGGAADKPDVTPHTDISATFGVTLQSPGDSITYDITIANQGTIDAVLKTITKTDTNNSAILFETSGVNEGDALNVGETKVMQVKVTYNPAVTSQPSDLESNLKIDLDYEQADGEEVTPPTPAGPTVGGITIPLATDGEDGLYTDEYEAGRYFYKGANPNNYITFNDETWRIMSIDSDGSIKIIRNGSIGNRVWDDSSFLGNNNWARPASLNTYLNSTYLSTITTNQDKIIPHTWSIGSTNYHNNDLVNQINSENSITWNGKVGMMTASEYLRANTNKASCGTDKLNFENRSICSTTNWMLNVASSDSDSWTITAGGNIGLTAVAELYGRNNYQFRGGLSNTAANSSLGVTPALYLSSDITLKRN